LPLHLLHNPFFHFALFFIAITVSSSKNANKIKWVLYEALTFFY
jgi:hypothetical protein